MDITELPKESLIQIIRTQTKRIAVLEQDLANARNSSRNANYASAMIEARERFECSTGDCDS